MFGRAKELARQEVVTGAIEEISAEFLKRAAYDAHSYGWTEEFAEHLAATALKPFVEFVLGGKDAEEAYREAMDYGHFQMFEEMYTSALNDNRSRRDAFMMLLLLDRELAENRGEPKVKFPRAWVDAGAAALEAAAQRGAPVSEQIGAGFDAFGVAAKTAVPEAAA